MISKLQIENAKIEAKVHCERHHEHDDCIRIAYEWLDAQIKTKHPRKVARPLKHIIENWGGRYVSQSDVEVAAYLHPEVIGVYPFYNISSYLTFPAKQRLENVAEAFSQNHNSNKYPNTYKRFE